MQNKPHPYEPQHALSGLERPGGEFFDAFWSPLGSLLAPFWFPLAPFWLPVAHFRLTLGSLWLTFGALWLTFGTLGSLLLALELNFLTFGVSLPKFRYFSCIFHRKCLAKSFFFR